MALAAAGLAVERVSCGGAHTAGVTTDGKLLTWGRGDAGQLGHGEGNDRVHGKVVKALAGYEPSRAQDCDWRPTRWGSQLQRI